MPTPPLRPLRTRRVRAGKQWRESRGSEKSRSAGMTEAAAEDRYRRIRDSLTP